MIDKILLVILVLILSTFNVVATEMPDYVAKYTCLANGDANISLILLNNKTFKLRLEIFSDDSKNDLVIYEGKWVDESDKQRTLFFDPTKNKGKNPKYLFIDLEGNKMPKDNNVELINDYSIKFNPNDKCISIWNVACCK